MALLTLSGSSGRALPVFLDVPSVTGFAAGARPVRLTLPEACTAALDDAAVAVVVDPAGAALVLGATELPELAAGRLPVAGAPLSTRVAAPALTTPADPDPALLQALGDALRGEPVRAARLLDGRTARCWGSCRRGRSTPRPSPRWRVGSSPGSRRRSTSRSSPPTARARRYRCAAAGCIAAERPLPQLTSCSAGGAQVLAAGRPGRTAAHEGASVLRGRRQSGAGRRTSGRTPALMGLGPPLTQPDGPAAQAAHRCWPQDVRLYGGLGEPWRPAAQAAHRAGRRTSGARRRASPRRASRSPQPHPGRPYTGPSASPRGPHPAGPATARPPGTPSAAPGARLATVLRGRRGPGGQRSPDRPAR